MLLRCLGLDSPSPEDQLRSPLNCICLGTFHVEKMMGLHLCGQVHYNVAARE